MVHTQHHSKGGPSTTLNFCAAKAIKSLGHSPDKTLGEAAEAAVDGNLTAETAVKIAKQAARLGQQY